MNDFITSNNVSMELQLGAVATVSEKDYNKLENIPTYNGQEWKGDLSSQGLNIAEATDLQALADTVDTISEEVADKADRSEIPTKTSDLTNDSDFVTDTDMQTALADKADKSDIPTVPTNISAFNNDKGYQTEGEVRTAILENTPTKLSDLDEDMMHRTVTDTEKSNWNGKSNFSGDYNDLTNKPTIPTVPTNVSAFVNDSGYQTSDDVATAISGKADASDVYTKAQIDTMLIMDITNTIFGGE